MSRLSRNLSANLLSNVWSTALALLLTPVYVEFLGVESYGLIGFYASSIAILGILDTGISATALRQIAWLTARPAERSTVPSLLRTLEVAYWAAVIVIGLGTLGAAWRFGSSWFRPDELAPAVVRDALMLMAVSVIIQVPSGLYIGGLMGLQRQAEGASLIALFGTIRAVGAVGVLLVERDIRAFFLWQIAASALQTGFMRWWLWNKIGAQGPATFTPAMLRSVERFAGGITLVTALSVVLTQSDKMILSRLVPLEVFGLYMLAWTVASGLSRVSTPLIQAFSPHFTELLSKNDEAELGRQVRLASRLMNALILPPAALIVLLAEPILVLWTGDARVASGAAPFLAVLVLGTVFSASSYPALSVLYSRSRLRPVLTVNVAAVICLLPLLFISVSVFGAIGAAYCWVLYGLVLFSAYQITGLQHLPNFASLSSAIRDFLVLGLASVAIAAITWYGCTRVEGQMETAALLTTGLMVGWAATLSLYADVRAMLIGTFKWTTVAVR